MPEDSKSRKERLKALRQAAQDAQETGQSAEIHGNAVESDDSEAPKLKFRNYALKDANIEHTKVCNACLAVSLLDVR